MKKYLAAMQFLAKPKIVGVLFTLFLITYGLLNYTSLPFSIPALQAASGGKTILNVLPYYDAAGAYAHIGSYSAEAIAIYYRLLWIDVLLLIPLYVTFLGAALTHAGGLVLRGRAPGFINGIAVLPAVAAALNLMEDGLILYLINAYPREHELLASVCGVMTSTKSVFLTSALLTVGLFYLVVGTSRIAYSLNFRKCHI